MLHKRIKALKEQRKMTVQEISKLSGVPASTITRILSGQTTDPGFRTVCDIIIALGGSVDDIVGIKRHMNYEESTAVVIYKQQVEEKTLWIRWMFWLCSFLILFLATFLILDMLIPAIGWIRNS